MKQKLVYLEDSPLFRGLSIQIESLESSLIDLQSSIILIKISLIGYVLFYAVLN